MNIKPLSEIDVGTKTKALLSQNVIMASDIEKKFRQDCPDYFVTVVHYLQSNLPCNVSLLQHAQYIHADKRNASESLSPISNLGVKITSVLNNDNYLYKGFGVKNASTDSIVDQVRSQCQFFQNEYIKKERYQLDENEDNSSVSGKKDSYWARAEELCGIESTPVKRSMKRIDDFCKKVDSLRDEKGCQKYPQLVALIKCVLFFKP